MVVAFTMNILWHECSLKKIKVDKQSINGEKQNLIYGSRNSGVSWTVSRLFQLLTLVDKLGKIRQFRWKERLH